MKGRGRSLSYILFPFIVSLFYSFHTYWISLDSPNLMEFGKIFRKFEMFIRQELVSETFVLLNPSSDTTTTTTVTTTIS